MAVAHIKRPLTPLQVIGASFALCLLLLLTMIVSLLVGPAEVDHHQLWSLVIGDPGVAETARLIVINIRLPRVILAGIVGFSLSLGGVVFQALLRNPLADPFILGVSSGGAFGAVLGIVLGLSFAFGIPLMSFGGALLTISLVMVVGRRNRPSYWRE
jgi:iron complex transport system permease protein